MEEILCKIAESVDNGEEEETVRFTEEALAAGVDPIAIIQRGLSPGVESAAKKFNEGIYFIPELMLMAESVKAGLTVLLPRLEKAHKGNFRGKILMGTVEADVHDLGKNICLSFLVANGFETVDAGVDVSPDSLVEMMKTHQPDIVGIGSYMTTTLPSLKAAIDSLRNNGFAGKVIIGGVAVSEAWADETGADGYADDAWEYVNLCRSIMGLEKRTAVSGYGPGSEKVKVR